MTETVNCPECDTENESDSRSCSGCGAAIITRSRSALPLGTLLRNYKVQEVLGRGGFGITYRASDIVLGRMVAIKEMFPNDCVREGSRITGWGRYKLAREDFLREARAMANIRTHPSLARVIDLFEENGTAYLAMEYVEGPTAGVLVEQSPQGLPEQRVSDILRQVGTALTIVHEARLLHRDVKPDNVVVRPASPGTPERAVLVDFGSAREFAEATTAMTQLITPGYAPIEQYGKAMRFGPQIDVYGLCATGYYMLTGLTPPSAPDRVNVDTLVPIRALRPDVSQILADTLTEGMAMRSDERFETIQEFLVALRTGPAVRQMEVPEKRGAQETIITDARPNVAPPKQAKSSVPLRPSVSAKPNRLPWYAGGAVAVAAVVALVVALSGGSTKSASLPSSTTANEVDPSQTTVATVDTQIPTSVLPDSVPQATTAVTVAAATGPVVLVDRGLQSASGVAIGPDGVVFVSDYTSGNVYRISDGNLIVAGAFSKPGDLAAGSGGQLFVVESDSNRISTSDGEAIAGTGSAGAAGVGGPANNAQLNAPGDISYRNGRLFIADRGNRRITVREADGTMNVFAAGINDMTAIATAPDGSVYVSQAKRNQVIHVLPGNRTEVVKGKGQALNLKSPFGVAVDDRGRLYIADRGNKRIAIVDDAGFRQLALSIGLTDPVDVAVRDGVVVIVDGNRIIKTLDP